MPTPIVMPRLGDFMTEGVVTKWTKAPGEHVDQGEVVAEIESEKLNYELEAINTGIFHPIVDEGATVAVDDVMGYLLGEGESPPAATSALSAPAATPSNSPLSRGRTGVGGAPARQAAPRESGDVVPSTPGARRLAASLGVDISRVAPSGPRGRVVEADIRAYAEQGTGGAPAAAPAAQGPNVPPGLPAASRVVPMQGMRRSIAQHMHDSLTRTAQLSYFLDVDVTEAQRLRRESARERGANVTLASVLMKACTEALKRVPALNTVLVDGNILYFDEINMGVAVALDDGLIVPVLRNVEGMDVYEITAKTNELSERAREGRLSSSDVVGGTFTISVLGVVDGFTPILNPPQNALLGVGRSVQKPVVRDGEIVVREMMTLSLTGDHQVVDGAIAVSFMRRLQQLVERPAGLFR